MGKNLDRLGHGNNSVGVRVPEGHKGTAFDQKTRTTVALTINGGLGVSRMKSLSGLQVAPVMKPVVQRIIDTHAGIGLKEP